VPHQPSIPYGQLDYAPRSRSKSQRKALEPIRRPRSVTYTRFWRSLVGRSRSAAHLPLHSDLPTGSVIIHELGLLRVEILWRLDGSQACVPVRQFWDSVGVSCDCVLGMFGK
jgi:hypothetical protein